MLSRYPRMTQRSQSLPGEWTDKFQLVLQEQYSSDLTHTQRKFDLFTELYPDELCFGLCLVPVETSPTRLPTTYIISVDLTPNTDPLTLMDKLVDSAEIFFDQFFANESAVEYAVTWQIGELGGPQFFYRVSRENLTLTQKANALLGDDYLL